MHAVTPVMFALVTANLINAGANWVLIYGHFGLPGARRRRLGVGDADLAHLHAGVLLVAVWLVDKKRTREAGERRTPTRACGMSTGDSTPRGCGACCALGLPAASQIGAEVGVFALATALSGTLDPISSAVASDRAQPGRRRLHDSARPGLGRRGARRARGRRRAIAQRASAAGWTAILLGDRLHGRVAALAFVLMPGRTDRPVHDRCRACCASARRCCCSRRCFSCSTASRA